ncbi:MAG: hypothetical protein QXF24_09625 [Thermoproteota archaeon]
MSRAAVHFVKRFPMFKTGIALPVVEFYLKSEKLHDPMLTEDRVPDLKLATNGESDAMKTVILRVKDWMKVFSAAGVHVGGFLTRVWSRGHGSADSGRRIKMRFHEDMGNGDVAMFRKRCPSDGILLGRGRQGL